MRSLVGKRKRGSDRPRLFGGYFRGVIVADAGGNATVLPYSGNPDDVLQGDGTWGPGADASVVVALLDGGEPPAFISDGAGGLIYVDYTP